jgi:phage shock protein A
MLDMENQLMQVKTQVAIAIADEHLLLKKQKENQEKAVEWTRKAEIAVDKHQDDLARIALERGLTCRKLADSFGQQVADQKMQVETLKSALRKLEQKLIEAHSKSDLMVAQHRRSRALTKASDAQMAVGGGSAVATFDRMRNRVSHAEAVSQAKSELAGDNLEDRLAALDREDEIEKLLGELKAKRSQT